MKTITLAEINAMVAGHAASEDRRNAPKAVGDVACRLVSDHQRGADRIFAADLATARTLVTSEVVIPDERLTGRRIIEILASTGIVLPERFWMTFQRAAIVMLMGRNGGPSVVIACERTD